MSSLFDILSPTRVRVIGLVTAVAILALLSNLPSGERVDLPFGITIGPRYADRHVATLADRSFAIASLVIGISLSWLFAHWAVRPGWRGAVSAALTFDLAAVISGSFLVALLAAILSGEGADAIAVSLLLGAVGLVLLGLPMLVLVFFIAILWVALVRLAVRVLGAQTHLPADVPHSV